MQDELNPKYIFSLTKNELLVKIVSGEIDIKLLAELELKDRGFDNNGKWAGLK